MAFSVVCGIYYGEKDTIALLKSMAVCAAAGLVMTFACRNTKFDDIKRRESVLFVSLGWIVGAFFSSLPFLFATHSPGFTGFADAYFEAMSGLTTTGASILKDVEAVSNCIMFWRSFTHWLGGMGVIVLFVAVMPYLGVTGKQMMKSEVPGPTMEGLRPRIIETARALWLIYIGISAAEVILLMLFGMNLFDSLCHTFGTMATGGFSTKNLSVGYYDSVPITLIITFFMVVAGANFSLYYMFLRGRRSILWRDPELRVYLAIIAVATALVSINVIGASLHNHAHVSIVHALFQVVSIMTTTGFSSTDFDTWPALSKLIIIMLMFVGGCSGSTGGGIKVIRIYVIAKHAAQSVFRSVHPEAVLSMRVGKSLIRNDVVYQIFGFFAWAIGSFALGSLVVAAFGHDVLTSVTATAATLWNIGPGLSLVGPLQNYSLFHPFIKIFLSFLMVLGRLEIFTVIVLFSRAFWKR
ncbi:MAG: TrkH family potassium uptake protein [bacterium]